MGTWKRLLTENDIANTNIGSHDLTINSSTTRTLSFGDASSKFRVKNNANKLLLVLEETTARLGSSVSTATLDLQSSGALMQMKSDNTVLFDKTNKLTIESDDTTNIAPVLDLYKNASAPADGNDIGIIEFNGKNSALEKTKYGSISVEINDVTDGTEDASMDFKIYDQGSLKTWLEAVNPNLNIKSTGDLFILSSDANATSGQGYPTIVLKNTDGSTNVDNDVITSIRSDGKNDAGENVVYAELETKVLSVADGVEKARFDILVKPENAQAPQRILSVTPNGGISADGVILTENENKLKSIEVRGTNLEQLTRRTLYNLHASSASQFSVSDTGESNLDLGSIAITPGLGTLNGAVYDYSETHGFIVPFDSFLTSATFAYKNISSAGVTGHAALKVYIVKEDGSASESHTMSSAASHANNDDDFRHSVYSLSAASQRSIPVSAGDKIVPRIVVSKDSGGSNYMVVDIVADIYLYTESAGL